jgi:DNA-binding PadR family transcriptional regulator
MSTAAGACGPGVGRGGFEVPDELVTALAGLRALMTGPRGAHGPHARGGPGARWGGPMGAAPWAAWAQGGPGRGWPFGPSDGGQRPRAARGDVRAAILALLAEEPRHGYQIIQDITERSGGQWKPSPGSVYPALSALQDEGLVDDEKVDGRRVFSLTITGRAHVEQRADELGAVFDAFGSETEPDDVTDLRQLLFGVGGAAVQVVTTGSPEQVAAARKVLQNARRDLYRLLAEEEDES